MYLNLLNEKEKELFLEMAFFLSNCDQDFAESEKQMIDEYRREMSMTEERYQIRKLPLEDSLKNLRDSSQLTKNAMFLELLALAKCDKNFGSNEQELIATIRDSFCVSEDKYNESLKWVDDMQKLYAKSHRIVNDQVSM